MLLLCFLIENYNILILRWGNPQIVVIDSFLLFILSTLAFVTFTLIKNSVILPFQRFAEFQNNNKDNRNQEFGTCSSFQLHGEKNPGPNVQFEINANEDTDINLKRRYLPTEEKEQLHKYDKFDAVCFITFLTYVTQSSYRCLCIYLSSNGEM